MRRSALALFGAFCSIAQGQVILSEGHTDMGAAFEEGELHLHVHHEPTEMEYEPSEVLLYAGENTRDTRPAGAMFDFIGIGPGQPYWLLPQVERPQVLYLGTGTEEVDPDDPALGAYIETDPRVNNTDPFVWVRFELLGYVGPGHVAGWQNTDDGPLVWFASSDGISSDDVILTVADSERHLNWSFTRPGIYDLRFRASTRLADGSVLSSHEETFRFGVEAVPEPTGLLALGAGVAALVSRRRRRSGEDS